MNRKKKPECLRNRSFGTTGDFDEGDVPSFSLEKESSTCSTKSPISSFRKPVLNPPLQFPRIVNPKSSEKEELEDEKDIQENKYHNPQPKSIVTTLGYSEQEIWDFETNKLEKLNLKTRICSLSSFKEGKIIEGSLQGDVFLFDCLKKKVLCRFSLSAHNVKVVGIPDKNHVIGGSTTSGYRNVSIGDLERGRSIWNGEHGMPVRAIDFNENRNIFITAATDYKLIVWDYNTRKKIQTVSNIDYPLSMTHSSEKQQVYLGGNHGVSIFSFRKNLAKIGKEPISYKGSSIRSLCFDKYNSNKLICGTQNKGMFKIDVDSSRICEHWNSFFSWNHNFSGARFIQGISNTPYYSCTETWGKENRIIFRWDDENKKIIYSKTQKGILYSSCVLE